MHTKSISQEETPAQTYNRLIKEWNELFKRDGQALIDHLRDLHYTDRQIGQIINLSKQEVGRKYPRNKGGAQ